MLKLKLYAQYVVKTPFYNSKGHVYFKPGEVVELQGFQPENRSWKTDKNVYYFVHKGHLYDTTLPDKLQDFYKYLRIAIHAPKVWRSLK